MSYYSITLDCHICSQNLGYFTTVNVYSSDVSEAIDKSIKKIRKRMINNYNYYTNDFVVTDIEKVDFNCKKQNYYFYNL